MSELPERETIIMCGPVLELVRSDPVLGQSRGVDFIVKNFYDRTTISNLRISHYSRINAHLSVWL